MEAEARSEKAGHPKARVAEGKAATAAERDPGESMPNGRNGRRGGGNRMRVSEGGVMRGGTRFFSRLSCGKPPPNWFSRCSARWTSNEPFGSRPEPGIYVTAPILLLPPGEVPEGRARAVQDTAPQGQSESEI